MWLHTHHDVLIYAETSIIRLPNGNEGTEDVTNGTVFIQEGSTNVVFKAVVTKSNQLEDTHNEWIYNRSNGVFPHGVSSTGYEISFTQILGSQEQQGTYIFTFGEFITYFTLNITGNEDSIQITLVLSYAILM